jgi:hypothetical protein
MRNLIPRLIEAALACFAASLLLTAFAETPGAAQAPGPGRPPTLNGSLKRTVTGQGDPIAQESWLSVSPAGTSRADDGTPVPIVLNVIWNLPVGP